jgi:hypothetical protein
MLAGMADSKYSADERHPVRPSIHAECDHGRGWWPCLVGPHAEQVRTEIDASGNATGAYSRRGSHRAPEPGRGDRSYIYVLDMLGLTVLVRVRDRDTFVHIDDDGMGEIQRRPVAVEVFNGSEADYGESWVYCDECGAILEREGECLDGDGYDGLCGNCADRAEAEGRWAAGDAELEAGG